MLGLILIYFIGKQFYTLAEENQKNQWLYTILSIAIYYLGTFIAGIVIVFSSEFWNTTPLEELGKLKQVSIAFIFGISSCVIFYLILFYRWKDKVPKIKDDIDKIGNNSL